MSTSDSPGDHAPPLKLPPRRPSALPRAIWAMGFASLLMDASSEMIHSLLPVFMVSTLGATMLTVGVIEGLAEATASVMKYISGSLSDRLGHRKFLMVLGYALAAASKPIFPLASSVGWVFGARFVDRLGKGIRGAPRDALVADLTQPSMRGAAFGLRQALDSVGAFLGPLFAVGLMVATSNDIRTVMWIAVIPAVLAVVLLMWRVHETPGGMAQAAAKRPLKMRGSRQLPREFWLLIVFVVLITLARFSDAFLVLRARELGLPLGQIPLIMMMMNVFYAGAAYPAGAAADRHAPRMILLLGLGLLIAADFSLAMASSPRLAFFGAALWGLHMALTQGLLAKLVADAAPPRLLGTAFGILNLTTSITILLSSVLAGSLWTAFGSKATFLAGAGFAMVAGIGLLISLHSDQSWNTRTNKKIQ